MRKGLVISGSIISCLCILIAVVSLFSLMDFKPDSLNIMHDSSENGDTFSFYQDDSSLIHVYAIGSVNCNQFNVSVTDSTYDYFNRNCDQGELYTTKEYTFLGELTIDETGTYEISVDEGEVIIVNADDVITDGFISFASCGCCMVGLILLIIGLATGKSKPQVMMIQPDGTIIQIQGQFVQQQQMSGQVIGQPHQLVAPPDENIAQPQEASLEQYSFENKDEWK